MSEINDALLYSAALHSITAEHPKAQTLLLKGNPRRQFEDFLSSCQEPALQESYRSFNLEQFRALLRGLIVDRGVFILTIDDDEYPQVLRHIPDPPKLLYMCGHLPTCPDNCIAGVGSRDATPYGIAAVEKIVPPLVEFGFLTISGMARGIDAQVHRTTIECGGATVAILGCGIDIDYPASQQALRKQIERTGLIISEYPPGYTPKQYSFPRRNRIISGLARGVVVFEADIRSGSLITARLALEQGRDVFAVPRSIFDTDRQGTNLLIKKGAIPISNGMDILEEFNIVEPAPIERRPCNISNDNKEKLDQQLTIEHQLILNLLQTKRLTHIDEIIRASGLTADIVQATLLDLVLSKNIEEVKGNNYMRLGQ